METLFFWWLILATIVLLFIGVIWAKTSLLNILIKFVYFIAALGGVVVIYHRFILNLPL